jgi:hypothetical protein
MGYACCLLERVVATVPHSTTAATGCIAAVWAWGWQLLLCLDAGYSYIFFWSSASLRVGYSTWICFRGDGMEAGEDHGMWCEELTWDQSFLLLVSRCWCSTVGQWTIWVLVVCGGFLAVSAGEREGECTNVQHLVKGKHDKWLSDLYFLKIPRSREQNYKAHGKYILSERL